MKKICGKLNERKFKKIDKNTKWMIIRKKSLCIIRLEFTSLLCSCYAISTKETISYGFIQVNMPSFVKVFLSYHFRPYNFFFGFVVVYFEHVTLSNVQYLKPIKSNTMHPFNFRCSTFCIRNSLPVTPIPLKYIVIC